MPTGFLIDPPGRGRVFTTPDGVLVHHRAIPGQIDQDWLMGAAEDPMGPLEMRIVTYYFHEYVIAGRIFHLWSEEPIPDQVDEIKIIMTLIDMAPSDIRHCEVPTPAELTIPVGYM